MKCPRCSYISFDYNQACPKCGNDLSHERDLMGFPSYQPKPLAILGMFAGAGEAPAFGEAGRDPDASTGMGADKEELLISLESLSVEEHGPIQFEPESFPVRTQGDTGGGVGEAHEDLAITLDDYKEDDQSLIRFEPETPVMEDEEKTVEKGPDQEWAIPLSDLSGGDAEPGVFELETAAVLPDKGTEGEAVFQQEAEIIFADKGLDAELMVEPEATAAEGRPQEGVDLRQKGAYEQRMEGIRLLDESEGPELSIEMDQAFAVDQEGGKREEGELDLLELELEPLELSMETEEPGKKRP